ncbi:MAG: LytTR family DNA-binding domain-containing protein [Eubacterium sp.]
MRIAIVDDLKEDRAQLCAQLKSFFESYDFSFSIETYASAEAFLKNFERERFDLCFMDIFMDGMNGMEGARKIAKIDPECMIIFLTISADYMAEGYDVRAWRYLLKPIDEETLKRVLPQCIERLVHAKRRLPVVLNGQAHEIPFSKILYVIRVGRNTEIHLEQMTVVLPTTWSFTQTVCPLLEDYRFVKSCNGVVVNMKHARTLSGYDFIMDNGDKVSVSHRRLKPVTKAYVDFRFKHL